MKRTFTLAIVMFAIPSMSLAANSVDSITMTAVDGVVRVESKDLMATATKAAYDAETGELKLEGSAKVPVTLHKAGCEFSARALKVSLKTGATVAHGIQFFQMSP